MKNAQFQIIVLSIEEVHLNWAHENSSPTDSNALNCGVFRGTPQPASPYDDDDCAISACHEGWDPHRRTHFLSHHFEGPKIWDICGNVGELMEDEYLISHTQKGYTYELTGQLKRDFGPKRAYSIVNANRRSNNWNLGYVNLERGKNLIVRGLPGRYAGIFSVDIVHTKDEQRSLSRNIGFRCVYTP